MNLFEKLKLLAEWSPLISYLQRFAEEDDIHGKAVIVTEAAEWIASRTDLEWDDELVEHISDMLRSEEGEAFVRWILSQFEVQP
tara:strand:- start:529 stop:780 length:252 start_codon:yes stop_codon:yes gene_type:complete